MFITKSASIRNAYLDVDRAKTFHMKKHLFPFVMMLPSLVMAQFPVPDSFQIIVHYITIDQTDWCGDHYVYGPNYCNLFSWQTPDTAGSPATLTGYRIYKDDEFFKSAADNFADTVGAFPGSSFYVTAVYENPAGESAPSNVELINDLPFGATEAEASDVGIMFDLSKRLLTIKGAENVRELYVYNVQGVLVFHTSFIPERQIWENWAAGVYWVLLEDKHGLFLTKKVLIF